MDPRLFSPCKIASTTLSSSAAPAAPNKSRARAAASGVGSAFDGAVAFFESFFAVLFDRGGTWYSKPAAGLLDGPSELAAERQRPAVPVKISPGAASLGSLLSSGGAAKATLESPGWSRTSLNAELLSRA